MLCPYQNGDHMVTVFIIEDEPILLDIYSNILELKGHKVMGHAYDGNEGLQKLLGPESINIPEPDFIIMDYRLPIKNGLDTMIELLNNKPNLKIIFISADISVKAEALYLGAFDFIEKPFNMETLFSTIEKIKN